jgi:hypothetical protein
MGVGIGIYRWEYNQTKEYDYATSLPQKGRIKFKFKKTCYSPRTAILNNRNQ